MVATILSALAPIVITRLLGFLAAWRRDFAPKEASVLNRMVLLFAVPLALFVGTVGTPPDDLVKDIAFVVIGLYALVFVLFRFVFRVSLSESVLAALIASSPAAPFMGPAILGDLFGKASAVTIAIISLIVVPITILGLALARALVGTTAPPTTRHSAFAEKLLETVKDPIVWAPVLGFVLVLWNIRIPPIFDHGLSLLGQASRLCRSQSRSPSNTTSVRLLCPISQCDWFHTGIFHRRDPLSTSPKRCHDPSRSPRQICRSRLVR